MSGPGALLPDDLNDRVLLASVHPSDWVQPRASGRYNLVVIGGGTAGLVSAMGAAGLGARVALVERSLLGGDCLNHGCVPSKAVLRAARAVHDARLASALGVASTGPVVPDFTAAMERMRRLRAQIAPNDSAQRLARAGVDVFLGQARFVAPDAVEVDGQRLSFARAVVATGGRAARPDVPGLAEAGCLTNETLFSLTAVPPRLAIIGAGPIGCELAQAFQRLGSQVTVITRDSRLLPRDEPDAAAVVAASLVADGVTLVTSATLERLTREGELRRVHLTAQGQPLTVEADAVLLAVGRVPDTEGLDIEVAGVGHDERGVQVDDHLRTANRRIYAAGDICSRFQFTHAADAMARIALQNALFFGRKRSSALVIPRVTYTDPEVAQVGLTAAEATERGHRFATYSVPLAEIDRAVLDGDAAGFARLHVGRRGQLLGATMVARHAGELISEITLAMSNGLGVGALAGTIHPYPTQSEAWKRLADAHARTRLTPTVKRLFERLLAWRR
jgi:pyruvate/2-oxoglutarate dehydrogenase complex dihydrolipoamide dehydrogenase (E3) component